MSNKIQSFLLILGVIYVVTGAFGISGLNFFMDNIEYIMCFILFMNGLNHILYLTSRRKDPYFHWGIILFEALMEFLSIGVILLNPFGSASFFSTYLGCLICIKGLILTLGRDKKLTAWNETKATTKAIIVIKGLLHFLAGTLIIVLPLIDSKAYFAVLGWYILFLGIHFITYQYTTKEENPQM